MTVTTDTPTPSNPTPEAAESPEASRRLLSIGMVAALVGAYGTLAAFIARFLYPARPRPRSWLYVADASSLGSDALIFRTPSGEPVNITRLGDGDGEIVALSSTCPHLGCQVHWEAQNERFFCPCHNGVFDPAGVATEGPPAEAGQSLLQYPVKVESGLLFLELPTDELALGPGQIEDPVTAYACRPPGPGHDPCLFPRPSLAATNQAVKSSARGT